MREHGQLTVGEYAGSVAEQVERFSGYLRDQSIDQILGEVAEFARRRPALFMGGAFTLGLLAARFLKSTSANGASVRDGAWAGAGYTTPGTPGPYSHLRGALLE
jgi:hypothetical protein